MQVDCKNIPVATQSVADPHPAPPGAGGLESPGKRLSEPFAMPYSILDVQPTPNPNAMKFCLDRPVADQPKSFFNADAAGDHPLAARLFRIPGVSSLLLLGDFITVNKQPDVKWSDITPAVKRVLSND